MTDTAWDGRGLPPVAQARIARAAADGVRTSLLPVAGAVGLQASGFEAEPGDGRACGLPEPINSNRAYEER